jgi:hypothetical protein
VPAKRGARAVGSILLLSLVFVKWADQPRTISARAIYTFKGQERSERAPPPFSGAYEWVATYTRVGATEREVSGFRTCVPPDRSLMSRDIGHTPR